MNSAKLLFSQRLKQEKPMIMGILNVTPDSFSDGGQYAAADAALKQALAMVEAGAEVIDVGGESTRPGSERVPAEEQLRRVLPVMESLVPALPSGVSISIDTTLSQVAEAALKAGAVIINDVSAGRDDPAMFQLVAEHGACMVLMHMHGSPKTMQDNPGYEDVVAEVLDFLSQRAEIAQSQGIPPENLILDPGIGFGKRKIDNLKLLAHLERFVAAGFPVLLGASRKRFMGSILEISDPKELVSATVATTTLGVLAGVKIFRVHDVKENRQALEVTWSIKQSR
ncbi:MAG: dihydropteroate synthase [Methylothermaceae bacteria B42]|nr:MAG: dihydropteroate synthase [Methylothermaceae bacteria B42]HHJ38023.1 dihydropteroate synthase [Methylothermaceae bacterium]